MNTLNRLQWNSILLSEKFRLRETKEARKAYLSPVRALSSNLQSKIMMQHIQVQLII